MTLLKEIFDEFVEAALDQPQPTARLSRALNAVLQHTGHPDRVKEAA